MARAAPQTARPATQAALKAPVLLAFASVYVFWGSTYLAIRIGDAFMPAPLFAGVRFLIAGSMLLAWCRWRGLKILFPRRTMLAVGLIALLLLGGGNLGLVYAERTLPSGIASLAQAVIPLYVALMEMFLPGGEPLPPRGWLGVILGIGGLAVLLWPSFHAGLGGHPAVLLALAALLAGPLSWTTGSVLSRRTRLPLNSFVAAAWQMLIAGAFDTLLGTALGQWPQFHFNRSAAGAIAYLIVGGSLLGYTAFIYLIEHVPVAKVASYTYVNPVVAVLLGIFFLGEHPGPAEFAGMAAILVAVFLLTTAQVTAKARPEPVEALEQMPAE